MIEGLNKSLFEVKSDIEGMFYGVSASYYVLATDIEDAKGVVDEMTHGNYTKYPQFYQIQEVSVPVFNSKQ